jgi:Ca2+-dependent lipid-binding protein
LDVDPFSPIQLIVEGFDSFFALAGPTAPSLNETTCIVKNKLNPNFDTMIIFPLPSNGVPPAIKLEVFDAKGGSGGPKDTFLGSTSFDLAVILASVKQNSWATATSGVGGDAKAVGTLTISVRPYNILAIKVCSALTLRNADYSAFSSNKSDPYVKLIGLTNNSAIWGETKTVRDNLCPEWNETFIVDYLKTNPLGGTLVPFVAKVWDEDDKKRSASDDPLGSFVVPWKKLWPNEGDSRQICALQGTGAKVGSTLILDITCVDSGAQIVPEVEYDGV